MQAALPSPVQGFVGVKTLSFDPIGAILDGALSDVEKTLDNVTNKVHDAAQDLIVQASENAARLIASLKAAYADSLELTYEKVDKLMQENLDRVSTLVRDIVNEEAEALDKVSDRIEEIVKLSPLSNWWIPLLSKMTPRFFAVSQAPTADRTASITKVMVTFTGNFAYADRPDCLPTFTLNGRTYSPQENTTKLLRFVVDISSDDPMIKVQKYSFLSGTLRVIWKSGWLPWDWTTSEYKTLLGVLPASPGKIKVLFTKDAQTNTQQVISESTHVTPNKKDWEEFALTAKMPHPGWHVLRGSSYLVWDKVWGQVSRRFVSDLNDQVIWTIPRKDGGGWVRVAFTEMQGIPKYERTEELDTLSWGDSHRFSPQQLETIRMITLETFNGGFYQFPPESDRSNPYIELQKYDGYITVRAKDPTEIQV